MIFEGDETLRSYVEESLEKLLSIGEDLLSIKEDGADADEYIVSNVIRAAHAVKSGAAFLGFSVIKDLSRNIENVLGLIRSDELSPNPDVVSVLLESFDKLKELLNNINDSEEVDISTYIENLIAVTEESTDEDIRESFEAVVNIQIPGGGTFSNIPRISIEQARKDGKYIYHLGYDLIKDVQEKEKTPFDVLNSLEKSGTIIECQVDIATVGTLNDTTSSLRIPFQVLYATIIDNDMMSTLTDIDNQYIHLIPEDSSPTSAPSFWRSCSASR